MLRCVRERGGENKWQVTRGETGILRFFSEKAFQVLVSENAVWIPKMNSEVKL